MPDKTTETTLKNSWTELMTKPSKKEASLKEPSNLLNTNSISSLPLKKKPNTETEEELIMNYKELLMKLKFIKFSAELITTLLKKSEWSKILFLKEKLKMVLKD